MDSDGTIWPQEKTIDKIQYYTKYHDTICYETASKCYAAEQWQRHRATASDHAAAVSTDTGSCDQTRSLCQ